MIPDGLVKYTRSEIESLASQALRKRPDVVKEPPINLELLVERLPNTDLKLWDGLQADFQCEGFVCKESPLGKRITVFVDSAIYRKSWAGYNAVLGEEFAHLTLHGALLYYVNSPEDFIELQNDPAWHQFEEDARRFSLALRMPADLVEAELPGIYARTIEEHGFQPAEVLEAYIRNSLAKRFRTSIDDVRRRISRWPCDVGERLLNSIQSKSLSLLPPDWTVHGKPDRRQGSLFESRM